MLSIRVGKGFVFLVPAGEKKQWQTILAVISIGDV